MPVTIGQTPDAGFDQPLKLLSDCHRRIEKFLNILIHIAEERRGDALDSEHRDALEAALRYFKNAAPWHTRDEEDSLFPRMRQSDDPRVRAVMKQIDALEDDHVAADAQHARVEELGRCWLVAGRLDTSDVTALRNRLVALRETYRRHIAEEDDMIFPLAGEVLSGSQLNRIGREMAQRRGIDPDRPSPRCRHAQNHPGRAN
ncbi:MAG: hemerythrin domain-containing protein [Phycisphaeraceae bacterium]|nr:hemerythrin domain-containing protein [Phycisphaeraceae bacterium]